MNTMNCIDVANKIVSDACLQAYIKANTTKAGLIRRKHVAYAVPAWCENLLAAVQTENPVIINSAIKNAKLACFYVDLNELLN